ARLTDHQHRARAARSRAPSGRAERERVHGCLIEGELRALMGRWQCLEADRTRPTLDPRVAGGLAEVGDESARVGQHAVIMAPAWHFWGRTAGMSAPVPGRSRCVTGTAGPARSDLGYVL